MNCHTTAAIETLQTSMELEGFLWFLPKIQQKIPVMRQQVLLRCIFLIVPPLIFSGLNCQPLLNNKIAIAVLLIVSKFHAFLTALKCHIACHVFGAQ